MSALLEGIRVLDLSQYAPGPYATRLLCNLGAEVIKIEPPGGDPLRRMFMGHSKNSVSQVYLTLNQGKQIATINLKNSDTREHLINLIANADVLLESFRPGVVQRLGICYQSCKVHNPNLVYCSLSGYGQEGPNRESAGHDLNYCAAAGMYSFNGPNAPAFPLVADHSGAMNAVNAILAALVGRQKSQQGAYLDISLYDAILSWQYFADHTMKDHDSKELLMLTGGAACYNLYKTADDRQITLGALEAVFWRNFCDAMDKPDWVNRQQEAFPQTSLIDEVRQVIAIKPLEHWVRLLGKIDCCFEPVPFPEDIYRHPQTQQREIFGQGQSSFPGKINGAVASSSQPTLMLEPHQLPNWINS